MGFLRRLFGGKKSGLSAGGPDKSRSEPGKNKRRWCFSKQGKYKSETDATTSSAPINDPLDANNHAVAVAAATAAAAEAALAAAHAAAEVVRLTSSSSGAAPSTSTSLPDTAVHISWSQHRWPEEIAAVKIQSAFRGYLAKRALRALRALVKLQALVRGHIVRKQTADVVRRMQTLVRLQSKARASRVHLSDTLHSRYYALSRHPIPEDYDHQLSACSTRFDGSSVLKRCRSNANYRDFGSERARFGSNWFNHCIEESVWNHPRDDEKSDKILEVDTWKPHFKKENFMAYDSLSKPSTKPLSQKSLSSISFQKGKEEIASRTAEHSPQTFSAGNGARRSPFITPTKSECSWGFFSGYSGHPNYMANTESSRAKVRSQSAPRQRLWNADFRSQSFAASSRFNRIGSTILS